jgi:DNA-binding PadR family transcriptional regulator
LYAVLGLIARHGPMTPYELKAKAEEIIGPFWPLPHAQLYRLPARLADLGLLTEETEEGGRHRRVFRLTPAGQDALARWLADPDTPPAETRDPAQLKLAFADLGPDSDLRALARAQAERHRALLDKYTARKAALDPADVATLSRHRMLTFGIAHERTQTEYWQSLLND